MFSFGFKRSAGKTLFIIIVLLGIPQAALSQWQRIGVSLLANSTDIEGKVETQMEYAESTIGLGIGGNYIQDSYRLYTCNFDIKDQLFTPALTLGIGFTGLAGEAEKKHMDDFDVGAVAFTVSGEYNFMEIYLNFPVAISAYASMAPAPLCFRDAEKYYGFGGGVSIYLVQNGAIYGGYRKMVTEFDDFDSTKVSDDAVLFGFKIGY